MRETKTQAKNINKLKKIIGNQLEEKLKELKNGNQEETEKENDVPDLDEDDFVEI